MPSYRLMPTQALTKEQLKELYLKYYSVTKRTLFSQALQVTLDTACATSKQLEDAFKQGWELCSIESGYCDSIIIRLQKYA